MGIFAYEDIFLTKGIEYLLVIDFLLIFILFWMALTAPAKETHEDVETDFKGLVEDIQRVREVKNFGPQWIWKWEIMHV
jgi:hypothetical protein